MTLDQIQNDARFEADVIVFNSLRKELKKNNITLRRNNLAPSSNYFEGRDFEHVFINGIPMYYGKTSRHGTEIKLHLDYIKVEMPVLYNNLVKKYGERTSGPEFVSTESLVKWFEENDLQIFNNKKLEPAINIGMFENKSNEKELLEIGDFKTMTNYSSNEGAKILIEMLTEKFANWNCVVSDFKIMRSSFTNKIEEFQFSVNGIEFKLDDTTMTPINFKMEKGKLRFGFFKSVDEVAEAVLAVTNLAPLSKVGILENLNIEEIKQNDPDSFFSFYQKLQNQVAEDFMNGIKEQFIENGIKATIVKGVLHLEGIPMIFGGNKVLKFNMRKEPELRSFLDLSAKSGGREFYNLPETVAYIKEKNIKSYKKVKPTIKIGLFEDVIKFNDFNK